MHLSGCRVAGFKFSVFCKIYFEYSGVQLVRSKLI
jgi:hypothetical protein